MSQQIRAEVSRTSGKPGKPWSVDIFDWDEPVKYQLPLTARPIGIRREPFETFAEAVEYAYQIAEEGGWTWV